MRSLSAIISFSLRHQLLVIAGAVMLVTGGLLSMSNMDVDVFPDLTAPTVVVMTDAHGMAAEEVERLVTLPIETSVNGAANVRRVRSSSMQGYSFVWTEFNWSTDIYKARQIVSEKMRSISALLPSGITPILAPQSSVMGEILMIGLRSDSTSAMELRSIADWVIKPAILATGGVSQVTNIGGEVRQYHILADPSRMGVYGVTLRDIEDVGTSFSRNSVGGVMRDYGNEYSLRGIAMTSDIDLLSHSFVKTNNGNPVVLSDVADVVIGKAQPMGNASQNATPAVILAVSKQPDINTLNVTKKIEANLRAIQHTLPPDIKMDTHIFRQADFIESSVANVGEALILGAILAVIVLFLFLFSFRTTIISVIAIPLSLLGAFIVLWTLDMNINTMTLGGMCIAIGSLVDDAIIDVENVYKRLKQNHLLPEESRQPVLTVVFEASKEIRSSILNATLIIMVAFIPLFFLSGMEGRMLKPLGLAFIISLFMSLIVAMTVTPLLCKLLLARNSYLERNNKDSWISSCLSALYVKSLSVVLSHKRSLATSVGALLLLSVVLFFSMGQSFLPDFNEGSAVVTAIAKPGVSLDVSDQLGYMMERELLEIPEITGTARRTGRGDLDEHSQTINSAEIDVQFNLPRGETREQLFSEMRHHLSHVPGIAVTIGQPLGHRIDHILSGTRANIAIKIFGPDLSRLFLLGNEIKNAISDIYGVVDVSVEQQVETPQIQIRANRTALARYGISVDEFNRYVEMAFSGEKIADIYEGQRTYDVVLRLSPHHISGIEMIKDVLIDTGNGGKVTLGDVAEVVSTGGPATISRENVQRKLVVAANVSGRDVGSAVNDIRQVIADKVNIPEGYMVEYGGQFESAQRASQTLLIATLLSLCIIFIILYSEFASIPLSAIVMVSLPLALIGGVLAVYITSGVVSIPSVIGFITLFGVATRNGILLISRYRHLQAEGIKGRETIIRGSADRLNPILMTALTSALALIPLVFGGDKAGNEIQSPMAIVVLGGLISSTILNLYVLPAIYEKINE